jgi:NAD(P)-dependent dehydrogenase (short-subunit alcohol dehydrogenase family)
MSVAIVGATGAVGMALARRVHATGRSPWLIGRSAEKLQALAAELNGGHMVTVADFSDVDAVGAAMKADLPADLIGLAYCVGNINLKPLKRSSISDFREMIDLHVVGAAEALKACEAPLKKHGGSAVLFSSVAVQQGFANHALISSAKGAVEGLTRALAAELAPKVRVNAIAPSISASAMAEPMLGKEAMAQALAKAHPLGRTGQPEDHAALASFLLSEDSSWITGQIIGVDGGRHAVA